MLFVGRSNLPKSERLPHPSADGFAMTKHMLFKGFFKYITPKGFEYCFRINFYKHITHSGFVKIFFNVKMFWLRDFAY
ncbi:MAG: hypothetical protein D8M61_17175 [Ignavibacteriae bacterium]|nr:hypothetical protein [Ignavibacteriota bacterium]